MDELRSRHVLQVADSLLGDSVLVMRIHSCKREALSFLDTSFNPLVSLEDSDVGVVVQYLHAMASRVQFERSLAFCSRRLL